MYFEERKESSGFHAREFGLIYCILQNKRKKISKFCYRYFILKLQNKFSSLLFFFKCFKSLVLYYHTHTIKSQNTDEKLINKKTLLTIKK